MGCHKDYFGDGKNFGISAHYSVEESPLGRGGATKIGFDKVPGTENTVVVLNGDTLTAESLKNLSDFHQERREANGLHLATVMVVPMTSPYGLVDIDESGAVTGFREKVVMDYWVNAGIYIFDRKIVALLPNLGDHETETFPHLAQAGQLAALKSSRRWSAVDFLKDVQEAEERFGNL